ncbi:MAG TPA: DUF427 domain-containing protein [Methylophilaceae bacterium]|nr:DUF427 domain-containing protein [Methylophilaceae bacterium]
MASAKWNGKVIAESDEFEVVEGNIYFPQTALFPQHFRPSDHTSICSWKGVASYYDVVVDDQVNENAAWYYPEPTKAAEKIKNHVAFWKGVEVST